MTDTPNTSPEKIPPTATFGRASLIFSVVGVVLFCSVSGLAFMAGFTGHEDVLRGNSSMVVISSFVMYGGAFLGIIGLILGIVSLVRKEPRTLGIIGLALGILTACSCAGLVAFGTASILSH
ncbi:MAG TPA: hypothetical protein VHM28_02195, partial [Anaerolineales bacterium]|jgi:hypothetical protein|nr:hypothetical protein [Anaerolineales bacterium]